MNLVTTQHSSNKFGSAFAAPRFSDLFHYFSYFGYFAAMETGGIPESDAKLRNSFCNSVANMQYVFCHLAKNH